MAEGFSCIECENLFDESDGDLDARTCQKCLDSFEDFTPSHRLRLKSLRFFLKEKGGDPRNHAWHEVSETMFDLGGVDGEFFKKILSGKYSEETIAKLLKG
tara:strand:- start:402 stop:704 length:303 start_codon:yes stop_codon:yes gene_type:complete